MDRCSKPTLIVLVGATGIGKTELSLRLAEHLGCPILNADSRQIYRDLPIGTAAPTLEQQQRVKHYFVGIHDLDETYNAGQFERDALSILKQQFQTSPIALLSGGGMMYIDAVCYGLDDIPETDKATRLTIQTEYQEKGLQWLQEQVKTVDPSYWNIVDQQNPQRLMHCLEVCCTTGQPYSALRKNNKQQRDFRIVKFELTREREQLYSRINSRCEQMIEMGLEHEARQAFMRYENIENGKLPNSLNTVGYKELYKYIHGEWTFDQALEMIKQNSRHYAKRQMTWWRRQTDIHRLNADLDYEKQINTILSLACHDGMYK